MAVALNKDPYTYQKERNAFLKELWKFNQHRGTSYHRIPRIGGKEVDLYLLYSKVNELGGWDKVTDSEQWEDLLELFRIPRACTNASQALKHICLRYLYVYQKVQQGDDPDLRPFENDDESSRKRKRTPHRSIPMRYNHRQHQITDTMRHTAGLCTDINATHDYVKLERSLLSGLPNEVDFAVNVLTLLSNECRRPMQLTSCPHLINLLLAHIGVFEHNKPGTYTGSYKQLSETCWKPNDNRNYLRFWLDCVRDKEICDLISPSSLNVNPRGTIGPTQPPVLESDSQSSSNAAQKEESDHSAPICDLLNLSRELGVHDPEGQRVLQMAMIIRNLSLNEENIESLASNQTVFRFLQLCIHGKYASLRQLGLDTLGSICRKTKLDPIEYRTTQLYLQTITRCISSQDKFEVTRGLEMLANLSLMADNGEMLAGSLEPWVYQDIVNMLLVHDIQLTVHTLEALYQLSELGHVTANHIADVRAAIGILVDLTTVEAQSYGPNSLLGIKVVEHVPVPSTPQQLAVAPNPHHQSTHHHTPSSPHHHQTSLLRPQTQHRTPQIARAPGHVIAHATPIVPHAGASHLPATPIRHNQKDMTLPPAQKPAQPTQQLAQHPEMDTETLACNWLKSYVAVSPMGVMTRNQLYTQYLTTCGRLGMKDVINTNSFANCVRVTFPKVHNTRVEKGDGTVELHYKGLMRRDFPLPFPSLSARLGTVGTGNQSKVVHPVKPGSPINKSSVIGQQLAGPSHTQQAPPSLPLVSQSQQHSPNYPIIQQALQHKGEGDSPLSPPPNQKQFPGSPVHQSCPSSPGLRAGPTPDSNLIKSLLANKVTANMHRTQHHHGHPQQQTQLVAQSPQVSQQVSASELASTGVTTSGQQQPQKGALTCGAPTITIPDGVTVVRQPPSPRSKLKMSLVAKCAIGAQAMNNKDELSLQCKLEQRLLVQKPDTVLSITTIDMPVEHVQNQLATKMEADVKQSAIGDSRQEKLQTSTEPAELSSGVSNAIKSELVCSDDKSNGIGANGNVYISGQQSESQTSTTNSDSSQQFILNGNRNIKQPLGQTQLDTINKDLSCKSLLIESDKLLTPEEIERRKQEEIAQLLDRSKDQMFAMNGVTMNHIGNGDCTLPDDLHKSIVLNPDKTSGLSLNNQQFKQQMLLQQQQKFQLEQLKQQHKLQTEKLDVVVENGYAESNHVQEEDSKNNIPSDLGRSVTGSVLAANNRYGVLSNNPGHGISVKQEEGDHVGVINTGISGNIDTGKVNTAMGGDLNSPITVDTAEVVEGGTNNSAASAVFDNSLGSAKPMSGLTIAGILKRKGADSPVQSRCQSPLGFVVAGVQQGMLPVLSVPQSGVMAMGVPAEGYISQLPTVISTTASASRPSALPTSGPLNPQLAKVGTEHGNVCSPTLANLPTPGDLASQMKSAMHQPPIVSVVSQQTVQASAIMQQLQQPMQQQQQQQTTVTSSMGFAAQMQQLQQRLQMPPQVNWPLTSQQQDQAVPTITGSPQVVSAGQVLQQQIQQQTSQTVPIQVSWPVTSQEQTVPIATVAQQQPQPQVVTTGQVLNQQPSMPKSRLIQRLQQPLVPSQPPMLIAQQPQGQPGQQQQQPILLQQQGVNGAMHQVVVTSNLVTPTLPQQSPMQAVQRTQTVTLVQSQSGQPLQVMSNQNQPVQVVSNIGQPLQVVNTQGQSIQVIQSQAGQQIQVVAAGQSQQLIPRQIQGQTVQVAGQPQQVQVMQGGLQVRAQQVQVMPGQCVQMVQGQPQVMQLQMQGGQPLVFQQQQQQQIQQPTVVSATTRAIQPAVVQPQPGQVKQGPMLLPRPPAQTQASQAQIIVVSQGIPSVTTAKPIQAQISQPQLPTIVQSQAPLQIHTQPQMQVQNQPQKHTQHMHIHTQQPQQTQVNVHNQQLNPTQQQQPSPMDTTLPLSSPGAMSSSSSSSATSQKRPSTTVVACEVKKIRNNVTITQHPGAVNAGNSSQGFVSQPLPTLTPPAATTGDYMCTWDGCKQCFETQKACSSHVVKLHFVDGLLEAGFCRWEACDKLKRQRWSLITHIRDRHLTEHALRTAHVKRQAAIAAAAANPTVVTSAGQAAAPPPVYPADAAIHAIRRFAPRHPYPEFVEPKEGPVTKHIRLTSALILRNIAKFSEKGRKLLLKHEKHLSNIALSSVEASTAVSHCLWEVHHHKPDEEETPPRLTIITTTTTTCTTQSEKH